MARMIQLYWQDKYDKIYYLFSNTGLEHEETLVFGKKMQDEWGLEIVWLEAVVDPRKGHGIRHKVVTFETASRNGEPMRAHSAKEGIPGPTNRKCSDRLKANVMASYRRSLGFKRYEATTAIGIRNDEIDRINPNYLAQNIVYPLISEWPMTKEMVYRWWQNQNFDLGITEELGNCVNCFLKSDRKIWTAMQKSPKQFDIMEMIEAESAHIKSVGEAFEGGERRKFYRGERTTNDMRDEAAKGFAPFVDNPTAIYTADMFGDPLDIPGVCGTGECLSNEAI